MRRFGLRQVQFVEMFPSCEGGDVKLHEVEEQYRLQEPSARHELYHNSNFFTPYEWALSFSQTCWWVASFWHMHWSGELVGDMTPNQIVVNRQDADGALYRLFDPRRRGFKADDNMAQAWAHQAAAVSDSSDDEKKREFPELGSK